MVVLEKRAAPSTRKAPMDITITGEVSKGQCCFDARVNGLASSGSDEGARYETLANYFVVLLLAWGGHGGQLPN